MLEKDYRKVYNQAIVYENKSDISIIIREQKNLNKAEYNGDKPEFLVIDLLAYYDKEINKIIYNGYRIEVTGKNGFILSKIHNIAYKRIYVNVYEKTETYVNFDYWYKDGEYFEISTDANYLLSRLYKEYFSDIEKLKILNLYKMDEAIDRFFRNVTDIYNKALEKNKDEIKNLEGQKRFEICYDKETEKKIISELYALDLQIAKRNLYEEGIIKDSFLSKYAILEEIEKEIKILQDDIIFRYENFGKKKIRKKEIKEEKNIFSKPLIKPEDKEKFNELNIKKVYNISSINEDEYNTIIKNYSQEVLLRLIHIQYLTTRDYRIGISSSHVYSELDMQRSKYRSAYPYYVKLDDEGKAYKKIDFDNVLKKNHGIFNRFKSIENNIISREEKYQFNKNVDQIIEVESKNKNRYLQNVLYSIENTRNKLEAILNSSNINADDVLFSLEDIFNKCDSYGRFILGLNAYSGRLSAFSNVDFATQEILRELLGEEYQYRTIKQVYDKLVDPEYGYIATYNNAVRILESWPLLKEENFIQLLNIIKRLQCFEKLNELYRNYIEAALEEIKIQFYKNFTDNDIEEIKRILKRDFDFKNLIDILVLRNQLEERNSKIQNELNSISVTDNNRGLIEESTYISGKINFLDEKILRAPSNHNGKDFIFYNNPKDALANKSIYGCINLILKVKNEIRDKINEINKQYEKEIDEAWANNKIIKAEKKADKLNNERENKISEIINSDEFKSNLAEIINRLYNLEEDLRRTDVKSGIYTEYNQKIIQNGGKLYNIFMELVSQIEATANSDTEVIPYNKERKIAGIISGLLSPNGANNVIAALKHLESEGRYDADGNDNYNYRLIINEFKDVDSKTIKGIREAFINLLNLKQEEALDFNSFKEGILSITKANYDAFRFVVDDSDRCKHIFDCLFNDSFVKGVTYDGNILSLIKERNDLHRLSTYLNDYNNGNQEDRNIVLYNCLSSMIREKIPEVTEEEIKNAIALFIRGITDKDGKVKADKFRFAINTENVSKALQNIISRYEESEENSFEINDKKIVLNPYDININSEIFKYHNKKNLDTDFKEVDLKEFLLYLEQRQNVISTNDVNDINKVSNINDVIDINKERKIDIKIEF